MEEDKEKKEAGGAAQAPAAESTDTTTTPAEGSGGSTEGEALDGTGADAGIAADQADKAAEEERLKKSKGLKGRVKGLISHLNIYFLLFIFILLMAGGITYVASQSSKKQDDQKKAAQKLSANQLSALQNSATQIGDPKSTLNIESNAVFSGKVLVKDSLDVAGTIHVGGSLALPGITVSGISNFDQVQLNGINVAGNANIQGQLTVQKGLSVSGPTTFGGPISAPQINIDNLQVSKDLIISRHIAVNGVSPTKSDGTALGSGGTVSVNGSDTAGTVTINTGSGPPAGCFVTVNFNQKFNNTPHIVITPVGSGAANLNYYINRSTSNFSICTTNGAPGQVTFYFDYVALD